MSIATDMAREWLDTPTHGIDEAARWHINALLREIADLQAQLDEALAREERRELA